MFEHKKISGLDDFFMELSRRAGKGIFFYRINGYTQEIEAFIKKYYEAARKSGVIIEGKLQNPDEKNLSYYNEIMGMDFQMDMGFISASLKKWLPRMNEYQRGNVATSIYDTLDSLREAGKNENMLRNAYIKFMCWLYYKFERIINLLGEEHVPKILYEGEISNYELLLITVLAKAGCDVVLLQYHGDQKYLQLDPGSELSDDLALPNMKAFPETFNLKWIVQQIQEEFNNERLYGESPSVRGCTNAWIEGKCLEDIRKSISVRGNDTSLFYNCFCRMNGVEDKLTYMNELFQFYQEIKSGRQRVLVIDGGIAPPTNEEIAAINRKSYSKQDIMLLDLSNNIRYTFNVELQRLMIKAFMDVMLAEAKLAGMNLNKLTNKAVYLLCWLKRYQSELFQNWKMPDVSCCIHMGACTNENEAVFLKFLARLPVDVLILNPNLNVKCCLEDAVLYEENYVESLNVNRFPRENTDVHIGTAAYHAERELDTLMYQDSGMYRSQQYHKANPINLQTMYEEIRILWNEDLKFRPNFSTSQEAVNIPVIYAKVSGVKDGDIAQYWSSIKELLTEDTFLMNKAPFIEPTAPNPIKAYAAEFWKNGKLQRSRIKEHRCYQYGVLRDEVQEHIFDKLQMLIESRLIHGTFENGTEYTIIATILNLHRDIVRLIQKFDFTKKNPKIIFINTGEGLISLEDTIVTAFLNLIGFDVIYFVPTGYQSIEKFFNRKVFEEHQIGQYVYDLQTPDFRNISSNARQKKWRDKIFKRGT